MSQPPSWRPGHRRVPPGLMQRIGKHILAIANINGLTVRISTESTEVKEQQSEVADDTPIELGDNVWLTVETRTNRKISLNLSDLNGEEFAALRESLNLAFDMAEPIVQVRDAVAAREMENGGTNLWRSFRGTPKVTVFKRPERPHDPSVPDGSENAVAGDEPAGSD